jgi:hypothetical protein
MLGAVIAVYGKAIAALARNDPLSATRLDH